MLTLPAHRNTNTSSAPPPAGLLRQVLVVLTIGAAACGSVNVRPYTIPLADALVDTLQAEPDALIEAAEQTARARGLRIAAVSSQEGYLETGWYEPTMQRAVTASVANTRSAIRVRFWADSIGLGRAQLISEAVMRRTADPSLPPREAEMMVPRDHPGFELLRSVLDTLRTRFGT